MSQSNHFVILDFSAHLFIIAGRHNLPEVVGIVMGVPGDLLTLTRNTAVVVTQGVMVGMTVQEGLGLFVLDRDGIVVLDIYRVGQHDVVTQCFLELRRHKVVTRTGS